MFLKPQDLTIGNYINYEQTTHIVVELHKDKLIHHWIKHSNDEYVTRYDQILSIPLTHSELENLGFNEDDVFLENRKGYFADTDIFVEKVGEDYWLSEFVNEYEVIRYVKIDFVHELQNMYYYHTKKEVKYSS